MRYYMIRKMGTIKELLETVVPVKKRGAYLFVPAGNDGDLEKTVIGPFYDKFGWRPPFLRDRHQNWITVSESEVNDMIDPDTIPPAEKIEKKILWGREIVLRGEWK